MTFLLIVLTLIVLAVLQGALIRRLGARGFSYGRRFSRDMVAEGEQLEFVETITNRGLLFLPWVRLEMSVPPSFLFKTKEEIDARGRNNFQSVFTLLPLSRVTRRHAVTPLKRGHYRLGEASVTMGDLMGVSTRAFETVAPAELFVAPALLNGADAQLPASGYTGAVVVRRVIQPDPFLINGIREYRMGDPVRDIHWAASARMNALQVKTHDFTANPALMVLINGQKAEDQWGDLMDYEQGVIEYGISLAATLCVDALRRGLSAGFAASLPMDGADECAVVLPGRGPGFEESLLRAYSCLELRQVRSFTTFLDTLPALSGMDIVILSGYQSAEIEKRMDVLRLMGNSVSLRLIREVAHE